MSDSYEKGKLYQFNGVEFVEVEPSDGKKLPVTNDAFEAVKAVRSAVQKSLGIRPELSVVASALLLKAARDNEGSIENVIEYGKAVYEKASNQ
jgi:hypothetical protein